MIYCSLLHYEINLHLQLQITQHLTLYNPDEFPDEIPTTKYQDFGPTAVSISKKRMFPEEFWFAKP